MCVKSNLNFGSKQMIKVQNLKMISKKNKRANSKNKKSYDIRNKNQQTETIEDWFLKKDQEFQKQIKLLSLDEQISPSQAIRKLLKFFLKKYKLRQQVLKDKFPNTKSVIINFLKTKNTSQLTTENKNEIIQFLYQQMIEMKNQIFYKIILNIYYVSFLNYEIIPNKKLFLKNSIFLPKFLQKLIQIFLILILRKVFYLVKKILIIFLLNTYQKKFYLLNLKVQIYQMVKLIYQDKNYQNKFQKISIFITNSNNFIIKTFYNIMIYFLLNQIFKFSQKMVKNKI